MDHHHAFSVTYGDSHNRSLGFQMILGDLQFLLGRYVHWFGPVFPRTTLLQSYANRSYVEEHVEIEQIPHLLSMRDYIDTVSPILQGDRRSLIVWTKSTGFRERDGRDECGEWCGVQ